MRAVVLGASGLDFVADYPKPQPADGDVLVRVLTAGICETDLQLVAGYMGFTGVLGHEFVGVAETGVWAGRRVVGEINCACRCCDFCTDGLQRHCPHRSVLGILNRDGAFADYLTVPAENLHPVPETMPTDVAVFTEPVAAAYEIPEQVELRPDMRVVVFGDGRLGNLCAQVIRQHGCRLLVVGKHREKLRRLQDLEIETALLTVWEPRPTADLVVDCTGSPSGFETAVASVKPRGTVVLKTTVAGDQSLSLAPLVINEITLIGSRCGPFDKALDALSCDDIQVAPLISARYPLDDALKAFDAARNLPVMKLLLDVNNE